MDADVGSDALAGSGWMLRSFRSIRCWSRWRSSCGWSTDFPGRSDGHNASGPNVQDFDARSFSCLATRAAKDLECGPQKEPLKRGCPFSHATGTSGGSCSMILSARRISAKLLACIDLSRDLIEQSVELSIVPKATCGALLSMHDAEDSSLRWPRTEYTHHKPAA